MIVRREQPADAAEIAHPIDAAFGDTTTSAFTQALRCSEGWGVPAYYPRFGFGSATALGLEKPDDRIPEEAWLALPLAAYDPFVRGRVVYPDFFPPPPGA